MALFQCLFGGGKEHVIIVIYLKDLISEGFELGIKEHGRTFRVYRSHIEFYFTNYKHFSKVVFEVILLFLNEFILCPNYVAKTIGQH